ncbi:MAG: MFS transporter [Gammaproteobacteria bacterium]|nr:MFS transporter [Gammaproteobacteria bacterium]
MTTGLPARGVLRHRDFGFFLAGRFLSAMAVQIQNVAVGWLVYDITGSALALGLVGLATFLPAVGLALLTGHAADRYDRRRILVSCYLLTVLTALGLLACAWVRLEAMWPVYALVLVFGATRAFANPAGQALLPNLVPREELGAAIAWGSSGWQTATIIGPAVGGVLYVVGEVAVFSTVALMFLTTAALFAAIRHRASASPSQPVSRTVLLAGIGFIRSRPVILGAISLDLFAVLLGGATALLPIFARDILAVGPSGLGLLRSAPAAGALAMALWLIWRPLRRHAGRRMFQAVAAFGIATIGFGLSKNFLLSLGFLFVLGAADMVSVVIRQTLVQMETPDSMRGRVSAVNSVFIGASNELGEFESGVLAALIGVVPCVVVGGAGTLLVAALWARWFPALRERDLLVNPHA